MKSAGTFFLLALFYCVNVHGSYFLKHKEDNKILWQIGETDNNNMEFSLAPDKFHSYTGPGIHIVGISNPLESWPYILPGELDLWTPPYPQTFEIMFYINQAVSGGYCTLHLDFLDTHSFRPPKLRVRVNEQSFEHQTPAGNNDWLMGATDDSGSEHITEIGFPVSILRAGLNSIEITATEGFYGLWDAIFLEVPPGVEQGDPVPGTFIRSITGKQILIKKEGGLYQPLELEIVHTGTVEEAMVEITGTGPVPLDLAPGVQVIEILIPHILETQELDILLKAGSTLLAKSTHVAAPVRNWEVHLIHQTHLDIGYTHTQEEVLGMQTRYLYEALDLIEKTRDYPAEARFKWHPEGMWAIDEFLQEASPERKQQFMEAIKDQSIHLDAFYIHMLTGLASGEELFELIQPAKDFEKEYSIPVKTAIGSDIPGYSWGLVPAMAQQGVKFLNTAPNNNHRLGHLYKLADKPFYWLGPNGQDKVFTWMASHAYIYFWWDMNTLDRVPRFLDYLEKSEFPYEIAMLRYEVGGDNGYPDPTLPDKVRSWNEKYAVPKIILSTNSQLYNSFTDRYKDEIPVLSGDLTPYWEDGASSTAADLALSRRAGERLLQSHALNAMVNPGANHNDEFKRAWNKIVMYDEHTWGAWSSISDPFGDFTVTQDIYKRQFALDADSIIRRLESEILGETSQAGSGIIDVYNTSSWERSDIVFLSPDQSVRGDRVLDDQGSQVPSQRMSNGELAFRADNVPAFGARRFRIEKGRGKALGNMEVSESGISNEKVEVTIDTESGGISSILYKGMERELVDASGYLLNDYVYIEGRETGKNFSGTGQTVSIYVEDAGPLVGSLRIESPAPGCRKLSRNIRLISGEERIELINTLDKLQELEPEGVYFAFPFNIPDGQARIDIPWGVIRPETDQLPGANRNYYAVQRWVDISGNDYGLTWVTPDAPMIKMDPIKIVGKGRGESQFVAEIGEKGIRGWWNESIHPQQSFYSWVMSNHWETNYKAYQEGEATFRYSLIPHEGTYSGAQAERAARDICQPLIPVEASPDRGTIVPDFGIITKQLIVTSMRTVGDDGSLMLRIYNPGADAAKAEFSSRDEGIKIHYCDPSGSRLKPAGNQIELPGYGITCIRIEHPAGDR